MKRFMIALCIVIFILPVIPGLSPSAHAQCAMCQASVSSSDEPENMTRGLNNGILYLLAIPYLLFAGFAITIYRSVRNKKNTFAYSYTEETNRFD